MANANVNYIFSGVGSCYSALSQGWLQSAMLSGTILVFNGTGNACNAVGPPLSVSPGVGPGPNQEHHVQRGAPRVISDFREGSRPT